MANQQLSPASTYSSSSASSTDIENIQGQMTLAQFIHEIEVIVRSPVKTLTTGIRVSKTLLIYDRDNQQLVNTNLNVDVVVAQREADSIIEAEHKTAANLAAGRHRVSPKNAERLGNKIYFNALCEDSETYGVSWRP